MFFVVGSILIIIAILHYVSMIAYGIAVEFKCGIKGISKKLKFILMLFNTIIIDGCLIGFIIFFIIGIIKS